MKKSILIAALLVVNLGLVGCATASKTETADAAVLNGSQAGKYKTLVYGEEKPLVCTDPVLAKGKLAERPNLQVMWENYLYDRPEGIWGEIGGLVEVKELRHR